MHNTSQLQDRRKSGKKMKLIFTAVSIYLALISPAARANLGFSDVLGKTFITGSGSTTGYFIMSVGLNTMSRSTVEVTFTYNSFSLFRGDISAIKQDFLVKDLVTVMINCREKTYTPGTIDRESQQAMRTYEFGRAYKWGDYKSGELLESSYSAVALTKYFQTACVYAAQF